MPTAADHRAEAMAVTYSVQTLHAVSSVVIGCNEDTGLVGGVVAPVLHRALEASRANIAHVIALSSALVDELERRARACDAFTAAWGSYEARHHAWEAARRRWYETEAEPVRAPWPGAEPRPPLSPFPGAVAG